MKAAITTNQITGSDNSNNGDMNNASQNTNKNNDSESEPQKINGGSAQNPQQEKRDFLNVAQKNNSDYLQASLQNPVSSYELQSGSIIPAILITGINSDLPGQITAQVSANVYDSIAGNDVLIPQGTKVIGIYDSKIAYGQERALKNGLSKEGFGQ